MRPDPRPAVSFYRSHVAHVRVRPHPHRFSYAVPLICVDIDRLDDAGKLPPIFSVGAFNLMSFKPSDHGARGARPLREHVEALVRNGGVTSGLERIELVCMPRVLGSAFNPLSVFYCWSPAGLAAVVYEVRNTFGERHSYVMRVEAGGGGSLAPHECDKLFYVSPFMDMALRYRFLATAPGETLNLKIKYRESFRPFAPSVLRESCADWFELDADSVLLGWGDGRRETVRFAPPPASEPTASPAPR